MEKTIYTRSWADGVAKDFSRDLFRSALFALLLLIGLGGMYVIIFGLGGSGDEETFSPESLGGLLIRIIIGFCVFTFFCWLALFFVANDRIRFWGVQEPLVPHIWEDREERWITSTVSFAHYLEERGSHIEAALVQYDDPRVAAHRMIDKVDERTLQLYLSLLSAMQMERERARVEWIEAKPKTLDSKTRQA
jgi:hypothetical protein